MNNWNDVFYLINWAENHWNDINNFLYIDSTQLNVSETEESWVISLFVPQIDNNVRSLVKLPLFMIFFNQSQRFWKLFVIQNAIDSEITFDTFQYPLVLFLALLARSFPLLFLFFFSLIKQTANNCKLEPSDLNEMLFRWYYIARQILLYHQQFCSSHNLKYFLT